MDFDDGFCERSGLFLKRLVDVLLTSRIPWSIHTKVEQSPVADPIDERKQVISLEECLDPNEVDVVDLVTR